MSHDRRPGWRLRLRQAALSHASKPMFVHCCHCTDCQRQTGTAFVLNALIEADRVELLSGDPEPFAMPTDSGRPHRVFRCPDCGTAVWSEYGGLTKLRFVRVGTLDDPTALPPDVHIFTRSKLPWITLPQDVPAFEVYYSSEAVARGKSGTPAGHPWPVRASALAAGNGEDFPEAAAARAEPRGLRSPSTGRSMSIRPGSPGPCLIPA